MAACSYRWEGSTSVKILSVFLSILATSGAVYVVDNVAGLGRPFDGIGGLSGGATSKLLVNYAEPYRSQILDYLFKPNFGASLHILKVEIGGDVQSTDGSESSHQHEEYEENYQRGYEWWLMLEAKKRNPDIKLYALPWGFPGWVGNFTSSPYVIPKRTASYITRWVNAAKKIYGLDMDYVGIWNERNYDITYIKVLRSTLDAAGYNNTRIVAADGGWGIANDVLKDPQLRAAVDVLGAHYPGTLSSAQAVSTGLSLWSSEDFSTFNDNVGAGCWARILNQNYVNGNMTSTISWNLIASYYQNLPFGRDALMTAMEPWSGHYVVESPIWVTAHTTQFANTTWRYLRHGYGSGKLDKGGSYVSLTGPSGEFTMVIETMTHNHSLCIRPGLPAYNVTPQLASFQLKGPLAKLTQLNVWFSKLGYNGQVSELFSKRAPVAVTNGAFSLTLDTDTMFTLTSLTTGAKGTYGQPPPPKPFPLPYSDNYENYYEFQEAYNFVPQMGVWEVRKTTDPQHRQVNRQVILHTPVRSCPKDYFTMNNITVNIGGNINWTDVAVQADIFIPSVNGSTGAFIGARVNKGGCYIATTEGIFFSVSIATGKYTLSLDTAGKQVVVKGDSPVTIKTDAWYTLTLIVKGDNVQGFIDTQEVFFVVVRSTSSSGFVAMGTTYWGCVDFDNLLIRQVVNGQFSVMLDIDVIYTLTTVQTGIKGAVSLPPPTKPFPLPYFDDYENYNEFQEASNFVPQEGVWEVRKTTDPLHGQVNRQVVLHSPVKWCSQDTNAPTNMGGNFNWTDVAVQADIFIPSVNGSTGAFIGARVNKGGCGVGSAQGLFFSVSIATGTYMLSFDTAATQVVVKGDSPVPLKKDTWYQLTLVVRGDNILGFINMDKVFFVVVRSTSPNGFVAMGTTSWGYADFDNFLVRQAD